MLACIIIDFNRNLARLGRVVDDPDEALKSDIRRCGEERDRVRSLVGLRRCADATEPGQGSRDQPPAQSEGGGRGLRGPLSVHSTTVYVVLTAAHSFDSRRAFSPTDRLRGQAADIRLGGPPSDSPPSWRVRSKRTEIGPQPGFHARAAHTRSRHKLGTREGCDVGRKAREHTGGESDCQYDLCRISDDRLARRARRGFGTAPRSLRSGLVTSRGSRGPVPTWRGCSSRAVVHATRCTERASDSAS